MLIANESPKALAERTLATLQRLQGSQGESVAPSAAAEATRSTCDRIGKSSRRKRSLTGKPWR